MTFQTYDKIIIIKNFKQSGYWFKQGMTGTILTWNREGDNCETQWDNWKDGHKGDSSDVTVKNRFFIRKYLINHNCQHYSDNPKQYFDLSNI